MKPLFDEYDDSYDDIVKKSIGFMGRQHDYYIRAKVDCLVKQLKSLYGDNSSLRVLDVGCGIGNTDAFLLPHIGKLSGVDISHASIKRARQENPQVEYEVYDGLKLPYEDSSFDAAFLVCVLHHVEPEERVSLLCEVRRILRPGGVVFIFEHNPFNPVTRLVVARCEFDRDAQLLSRRIASDCLREAEFDVLDAQYMLYLPFQIANMSPPVFLRRRVPLGAQYFVSGIKREN